MAFVSADRVSDTTTVTGTGNVTVSGVAPTGYRTLSAVLSVGDTFYYCISDQTTGKWETGTGTYVSANVFARTTVLSSSNSGSLVAFTDGTKTVFVTFPAAQMLQTTPGTVGASAINVVATGSTTARTLAARFADVTNVKDFGATGNSSTDDTSAIQAAINSLPYGGVVYLPTGTYKISSALVLSSGVSLIGNGDYATTILTTSATADVIRAAASSRITDMQITSSVTKTSGSHINIQYNGVLVQNLIFTNYYTGITIGTIGASLIVNPEISSCSFYNPVVAVGSGGIAAINFSNCNIDGIVMSGTSGTQADYGILVLNGDTITIENSNITLHGIALYVAPPSGSGTYALAATNVTFDSAGTNSSGAVSSCQISPEGLVWNTRFSNCWFGLSTAKFGCYVAPTGSGAVDGILWSGCDFPDNGDGGLIVVNSGSAYVKNWIVNGCGAGGNTNSGIRAAGGTSYFNITGCVVGNYSGRGNNNYGIIIDNAASANYLITNNNLRGNTTAAMIDSGTGANAQVYQNSGYNGENAVVGLTVGASPWTYTAGHTPETIYIQSGTISTIQIDSQVILTGTNHTVFLVPNESMILTYSSLPTVLRKSS